MNELIGFLVEPYQNAALTQVALEIIAALFGVVSVFYARKENILVFPTGIISTAIYVYLLAQWSLYGDLIINVYYTLMSMYGWYMWLKVVDKRT
ncbi:MAG: nicotinamide riboside transporter PnuC, partial [Bacteroidales bacterium]|nr:nicotinamide riboside transporter PnuC [Bacteroidales bacterium]